LDLPELPTAWKQRSNGLSGLRRKSRFDTNGMEPGTHNLRQAAQAKSSCTWSPPERGETRPNWRDSHLTFCPVNEDTKKNWISQGQKNICMHICVFVIYVCLSILMFYVFISMFIYTFIYMFIDICSYI
jgi:hypothetical protein